MTRIALGGISLLTPLTGIGQYTSHLAQGLINHGVDVDLFLGHQWIKGSRYHPQKIADAPPANPLIQRAWQKLKRQIPGARQTLHHLRQKSFTKGLLKHSKHPIDVYHEPNFIPWHAECPTVITVHDLSWIRHPETHPQDRVAWLNQAIPNALERANQIIVVSDFVKEEILREFGGSYEKKVRRIYNGVSAEFRPYQAQLDQIHLQKYQLLAKSYFLALGTLEPRKNLQTILKAYSLLPQALQQQFPLVLAGARGWLNESLDQALQMIPKESLRVLGYVPQSDLPAITAGATALLYASKYEGFGLPPLEAMASGTPVISSNAKAMSEVIQEAGYLIDPDDVTGFQAAMEELINDGAKYSLLQTQGLKRASAFSWNTCAQETLTCYQDLIKV